MLRKLMLAAVLTVGCAHSNTPAEPEQAAPPSIEEAEALYKDLVRRAEAGEEVDFRELRLAWLYGPAMKPIPREDEVPALKKEMFEAMQEGGDPRVVLARAREILDIHYVDLDAQKARRQACELINEEPCQQYRTVSLGMLRSVVEGRDGTSCPTAWRVISIDEEYFVLRMLDARFERQSLVTDEGGICDALDAEYEGEAKTFYFDVSDVFIARKRKMGLSP